MIPIPSRKDSRVAVFGLGGSGLAAAKALVASGARVSAWDDDATRREAAAKAGLPLIDLYKCAWAPIDALVLAPGIPLTHPAPHPVAALASSARKPILGDIELFAEAAPEATVIGITGTNGKSTVTALLGHLLRAGGRRVEVGGNLGPPVLALDVLPADGAYVLELSSYQLDLTHEARFDIAVLINVSPDHLDRHGDLAGYIAAKRRIFRVRDAVARRPVDQTAIVGIDDGYGREIRDALVREGRWRVVPVSGGTRVEGGVYVTDGVLHDETGGDDPALEIGAIATLPGRHNWQNAACAWAAARAAGAAPEDIAAAMATYPGLAHRQEWIAEIRGVAFVNNSKATNGKSAARALDCYDNIYWIIGGQAKSDGLAPTLDHLAPVRQAYAIGAAADRFMGELSGRVPMRKSGTLDRAVREAYADARQAGAPAVVLLSPACASFDQFANFEARGAAFRAAVERLAKREAR